MIYVFGDVVDFETIGSSFIGQLYQAFNFEDSGLSMSFTDFHGQLRGELADA